MTKHDSFKSRWVKQGYDNLNTTTDLAADANGLAAADGGTLRGFACSGGFWALPGVARFGLAA